MAWYHPGNVQIEKFKKRFLIFLVLSNLVFYTPNSHLVRIIWVVDRRTDKVPSHTPIWEEFSVSNFSIQVIGSCLPGRKIWACVFIQFYLNVYLRVKVQIKPINSYKKTLSGFGIRMGEAQPEAKFWRNFFSISEAEWEMSVSPTMPTQKSYLPAKHSIKSTKIERTLKTFSFLINIFEQVW